MNTLKRYLHNLPESPGVYQFIDKKGDIIYIGKAINLKKRVNSYFHSKTSDSYKLKILVNKIDKIKHIIVDSESEALLLENTLIKKIQPRYNVLLKDDKTFPWICIKNEPFPRVFSTRKLLNDNSEYFGPYTSAVMVKTLLQLIRELYKLRTCNYNLSEANIVKMKFKKCLEFHIGNCLAPCEGLQSREDYSISINEIRNILKGNIQEVIVFLQDIMLSFSEKQQYEQAENVKQKINLLKKYKSKSTVVNPKIKDVDVYSYLEGGKSVYINFLKVINGAIIQSHNLEVVKKIHEDKETILELAVINIREKVRSKSKDVVVPFKIKLRHDNIKFIVPQKGDKIKLLKLSERNARQYRIEKSKIKENISSNKRVERILTTLKNDLKLKQLPKHIECFDNSNIQGSNPASACVVFWDAIPKKSEYRHYNIKSVKGPDDFASMEEVVFRRYNRLKTEQQALPQLIVIDGGKGQLNAAVKSLKKLGIHNKIAIIGIAKRLEEIYFPNDPIPLYIDKKSESMKIIQQIRDEAHRFSLKFHQQKRSKTAFTSSLTEIDGIGEKTEKNLLLKFKSVENIRKAKILEIEKIVGLQLALKIAEYLKNH